MSTPKLGRSALVISTTPPAPRDYGNRNRVFQTLEFLRQSGFTVSLLLYPFDEDWASTIPPYYKSLMDQFEYFDVVPNSHTLHLGAAGYHHTIDEWWDETIGQRLHWLFKRKRFDILFVNYTFLSKAFDYAPKDVLRILDTHDLFTGRREAFECNGVGPEFFYTNAEQEKIAFDRCDAIIAIKSSEAEFIRTLTDRHVVTIPYWDSHPVFPPSLRPDVQIVFSHDRPLRLGFIGAHNSVNLVNIRRFLHVFDRFVRLYNLPVEVVVAGNVCRELHTDYAFLRKLGRVERIEDFYLAVDAILAPLEFSTGIKIKVGEALVWQMPVLATANAFDGFRSFHPTQAEPSVASLCQSITSLATNEISYGELAIAARHAGAAAARAQEKGFADLRNWIKARMQRIVIITDRPFWYRGTFLDELVTQTIEYVAHISPTIVVVLAEEEIRAAHVYAEVEYIPLNDESAVAPFLAHVASVCSVSGAIVYVDPGLHPGVIGAASRAGMEEWTGGIVQSGADIAVQFRSNDGNRQAVTVSPLRYAPVQREKKLSAQRLAMFRPSEPTEWESIACEFIANACKTLGLYAVIVDVPPLAEYSAEFFHRSMGEGAARAILFERSAYARLFVCQANQYRDVARMIIGETLALPGALAGAEGLPSLADSIMSFLTSDGTVQLTTGPNTGWDRMWAALDRASSVT